MKYLTDPMVKKHGTYGYSGRENFLMAIDIALKAREAGIILPMAVGEILRIDDISLAYFVKIIANNHDTTPKPHRKMEKNFCEGFWGCFFISKNKQNLTKINIDLY